MRKSVMVSVALLFGLLFSASSVYAGSINGPEAGLISKASGTFQYQGKRYVATAAAMGQLRAYLMSDEGKEITLYRLLDGDVCFLSASCILKNISFDIYVDTEEETELYLIQASAYDALGKSNLAVQTFLQETISARFSDVMWVVEQIVFMKFDRRLAIFLLEQAALEGNDAVTLTHEQIAHHMGSAREVVSRMLKYFQNEGLVEVSRKGIRLLDRKALNALARE